MPPEHLAHESFLAKKVESLRLKLLDLSGRNALLNFRHRPRSRKMIRVVDEVPDLLMARLMDGSTFQFRALSVLRPVPADEQSARFRKALREAEVSDLTHRQELDGLGEDASPKALERLDHQLRSRVRQALGMPARDQAQSVSVEEAARRMGIDPSFDLPSDPQEGAAKHSDSYLQTLLEPEDLEKTLSGVYGQYRSSLDELGVNSLFLIAGFLEWYDSPDSESAIHAPLLMLPLEMSREPAKGRFITTICGTDDPPQTNITLRERLKRDFQLVLPEFDEEKGAPEQYFEAMGVLTKDRPHWKIRRWVTVAHLGFARMAMYHDLADAGWTSADPLEEKRGIHRRAVVRRILGGVGSSASDGAVPTIAESDGHISERPVEGTPETRTRPRIVLDADSSQVAAILDALDGHDLVVEGPPGTGKSQTIANLIAAAMAEGKSVLFVAEKMAALRVVHDRLKKIGLDPFCLEMHSNRAKRKDVAESIKRRLDLLPQRGGYRESEDEAEEVRAQLSAYCQAINANAGQSGLTIHQVLWRIDALRQRTIGTPTSIEHFDPGGAHELSMNDIEARVAAMARLVTARTRVADDVSTIGQHPWRGLASPALTAFEAEELAESMGATQALARRIVEVASELPREVGMHPASSLETLTKVSGLLAALPRLPALVDQRLWMQLSTAGGRGTVRTLLDLRRAVLLGRADIGNRFGLSERRIDVLEAMIPKLEEAAQRAVAVRADDLDAAGWEAERARLRTNATSLRGVCTRMSGFASAIGVEGVLTPDRVRTLRTVATLLTSAPAIAAANRSSALRLPNASQRLRAAIHSLESFQDHDSRVRTALRTNTGDEPQALDNHVAALRRGGLLVRFRKDFRSARDCYQRAALASTRERPFVMADRLLALAERTRAERQLKDQTIVADLCGDHLLADPAKLRDALSVSIWLDQLNDRLSGDIEGIAGRLAVATPEAFAAAVAAIPPAEDWTITSSNTLPITEEASQSEQMATRFDEFVSSMAEIAAPAALKARDLIPLAKALRGLAESRSALLRHSLDTTLLSDEHSGHSIPENVLENALAYVQQLSQVVSSEVLNWLVSDDTSSRLTVLRDVSGTLATLTEELGARLTGLEQRPDSNVAEWLGEAAFGRASPGHIAECALRAITYRFALQRLVDFRRSEKDLAAVGCAPVADALERAGVTTSLWADCLLQSLLRAVVKLAVQSSRVLREISENRLDQLRKRYRELDRQQMGANAARLYSELSSRVVEPGIRSGPRASWTSLALLDLEANKQKRHIALRRLFRQAGEAATTLMPCFLMSPLSVAQFLPPGELTFDLVVMDEASQLRPEDALGAIARARQVVVVGDPKQLPPTNFFVSDAQPTDIDDDAMMQEDDESILDAAAVVLPARRRLLWHYRSRHPSLIHFSNSNFYDQSLICSVQKPLNVHRVATP